LRNADITVVSSRRLGEKYCPQVSFIVANRSRVDRSYCYVREPERSLTPRAILYVGRLSPEKGVATLLEAMATIKKTVPDVRLTIAGDGRQRCDLQDLARQQGLQQVVEFRGWVEHGAPLLQLYRQADVFCMPSYSEGQPGALLEALAAALPAVVTRTGGMVEVIDHGQAGFVVPPRDPQALAQALLLLLTQPPLHRQMAQNAFKVAQENTFERQTGTVVAAIRWLLRQREMRVAGRKVGKSWNK
jgi:glycosyltransferase involved in cell wall biosynthesis